MINREQHAAELMHYDRAYKAGGLVVAGMDEVGRGPLAGSVVTACVVMPEEPLLIWIDDSKKLSEARREKVFEEIMQNALYVGIGEVSPAEIDDKGYGTKEHIEALKRIGPCPVHRRSFIGHFV